MTRKWSLRALFMALAALGLSCRERAPLSYDFEESRILDDIWWTCRTLYRLSPEHPTSGTQSLELSFFPAPAENRENFPGVTFPAFDPDWTGRRALAFEIYNPEDRTLGLTLRIDDRREPGYADRLNRHIAISPGANSIAIPLAGMVTSGSRRPLDLTSILRVSLFMPNPREPHRLYLDQVRLE